MAVEQLGEVVSIYLDGGPSPITVPSTILDLTNEETRVIRIGAIELDEIREVVPGVIGPDGEKNE